MKREDACACGEFCDCALSGPLKLNTAIPSGEKGWQQGAEAMREACAKIISAASDMTYFDGATKSQRDYAFKALKDLQLAIRALPIPEPPK